MVAVVAGIEENMVEWHKKPEWGRSNIPYEGEKDRRVGKGLNIKSNIDQGIRKFRARVISKAGWNDLRNSDPGRNRGTKVVRCQ